MSAGKTVVPLQDATHVASELSHLLAPACVRIEVAGSVRRLRPYVGDVELVAIPKIELVAEDPGLFGAGREVPYNLLWKALDGFLESPRFHGYQKKGDKFRSFRWPVDPSEEPERRRMIQVDLFTTTELGWGWIYLVRTGSAGFSKHVASCLKAKGFIGHEGRIYHRVADQPRGEAIGTPGEEDVFRLAGMKPVEPAERSWG